MRATRGLYQLFVFLFLAAAASFQRLFAVHHPSSRHGNRSAGRGIASAVVTLSNAGTGFNRSVTTDQRGEYQFVQVAPGTYKIDGRNGRVSRN